MGSRAGRFARDMLTVLMPIRAEIGSLQAGSVAVAFEAVAALRRVTAGLQAKKDDPSIAAALRRSWRMHFAERMEPLMYPLRGDNGEWHVNILLRAAFFNPRRTLEYLSQAETDAVVDAIVKDCAYIAGNNDDEFIWRALIVTFDKRRVADDDELDSTAFWLRTDKRTAYSQLMPVIIMYASVQPTSIESERSMSAAEPFSANMKPRTLELCTLVRMWLQKQSVDYIKRVLLAALEASNGKYTVTSPASMAQSSSSTSASSSSSASSSFASSSSASSSSASTSSSSSAST